MTNDLPILFEKINTILGKASVKKEENICRGECFNIFEISGLVSAELFHSSFIAEMLNPKGSHGQKDIFLNTFLAGISEIENYFSHSFDVSTAEVMTEYVTEKGRLDVMIKNSSGQAIIIENKIYHGEEPNQIKRYQDYAFTEFGRGNYVVLYLTLDGREPETADENKDTCLPISYRNNILNWIRSCIDISSRLPAVREVLIQYEYVIKLLTNQVMEDLDKNAILELLIKRSEVAKAIYSLRDDYVVKAVKDYLFPQLKKLCGAEEIELRGVEGFLSHRAKKEFDCSMTPKGWESHDLLFGCESTFWKTTYVGVRRKDGHDNRCSNFKCLQKFSESWDGGWTYLPDKFDHISYDTVPEIVSGEFAKKIFEIVKEIKNEAEQENYSM